MYCSEWSHVAIPRVCFFLCHMELECIPSSIYPTCVVVKCNRREIMSAVMSVPFSWTRIICCLIFFLLNALYGFWHLHQSPTSIFVWATRVLFHFFSTFQVLSPPIVHLSLHSAFVVLIWTIRLLVSLKAKSSLV